MDALYYSTSNLQKWQLFAACLAGSTRPLQHLKCDVPELLETDLVKLIRAKAAAAYQQLRVPLIVEHGGLFCEYLKGLPGPLVKPVWSALGSALCQLIPPGASRRTFARSAVCYCDGMTRKVFVREVDGELVQEARGTEGFHWDPLFIPSGETRTFAEMPLHEKLRYAPAALAFADLRSALGV